MEARTGACDRRGELGENERLYSVRGSLSAGYGLRLSTEICGSEREKKGFHEYLQEYCFVLTGISESLH